MLELIPDLLGSFIHLPKHDLVSNCQNYFLHPQHSEELSSLFLDFGARGKYLSVSLQK